MKSELDAKITAGLGIAVFVVVAAIKGPKFATELWDALTTAVGITLVLRSLFVKWIWKWLPFLERLHGVPLIEGNWKGKYESTYSPSPGAPNATGTLDVKVTQPNLFQVKITQETKESVSHSYGEEFETKDDGSISLNFSYQNIPKATVRDRSEINFGSARYRLTRDSSVSLAGNYWTDRKSTGTITMTRKAEAKKR